MPPVTAENERRYRHEIRQHLFGLPGVLKVTVGFVEDCMHVAVYGGDMIHVAKTVQGLKPDGMKLNLDFMERSVPYPGRSPETAVASGEVGA